MDALVPLVADVYELSTHDLDAWQSSCARLIGRHLDLESWYAGVMVFAPEHFESLRTWPVDDIGRALGCAQPLDGVRSMSTRDLNQGKLEIAGDGRVASVTPGVTLERGQGFARVVAPVPGLREPRTLAMQVQTSGASCCLTPLCLSMLEACAVPLARAYGHTLGSLREHRADLLRDLPPLQRLIAPLLIEGRPERLIADQVGRSPHTVHDHVKSIYAAWGVSSRIQLRDRWYNRSLAAYPGRE